MWHDLIFYAPRKLAWSIKHPSGVTYTRGTYEEAIAVAADLAAAMRASGIKHHRVRVFKTYGKAA